jgi:hypothetical protein
MTLLQAKMISAHAMSIWNEAILSSQPYEDAGSNLTLQRCLSSALLTDKLCTCPLLICAYWNPTFLSDCRSLRKQWVIKDQLPPSVQCLLSIPHMNKNTSLMMQTESLQNKGYKFHLNTH